MNEKTLLRISLICALFGVFVLYIISDGINLDEASISGIKGEDAGSDAKLKGVVKSVFNGEKASIITITKPEELKVVIIKKDRGNISVKEGDYIEVVGEIEEYEGEMQMIGNRIRVVS